MTDSLAPDSTADMTASHTTRIGLLTDIHWTPEEQQPLTEQLNTALEHFNNTNVDHIVILGDLIMEGDTESESANRLSNVYTTISNNTDIPVKVVPGNHDVMNTQSLTLSNACNQSFLSGTRELADDITGIFLDTSAPKYPDARGEIGSTQRAFLDASLDDATYAVVFSHHPLYYHDLSGGWFEEHPEAAFASDKYLANEIFNDHDNILAVVNGHTHIANHTMYEGTPHFTINAFNEEQPNNTDPNGSFAVLEVSPSQVKRVSHRHGTFETVDTVDYPAGDQTVALGGTFGPLHDGHRQMFQRAFEVGDVMVGITSDELAQKTRHTDRHIPSFTDRKTGVETELESLANTYNRDFTINKLTDPMGPVTTNATYTHLIVSPETFSRGEQVNEKRLKNGLEPMSLEVVEPLLADDGQRISSTRIVNNEIDEHGNLID